MRYLVVLAICGALFSVYVYAQAQRPSAQSTVQNQGRFVIVASSDDVLWRLDTTTGGLIYCLAARGASGASITREAGCTVLVK